MRALVAVWVPWETAVLVASNAGSFTASSSGSSTSAPVS
jgi:hypothetical protein